MKKLILVLGLGTLPAQATVITPDQINTANGYTITTPGTYTLQQSVDVTAVTVPAAITIAADNVTLNLSYYTLNQRNSAATTAISVASGYDNVTITNGITTNWTYAISVSPDTTNVTLSALYLQYSTCAVLAQGTADMPITGLTMNTVTFQQCQTGALLSYAQAPQLVGILSQGYLAFYNCTNGSINRCTQTGAVSLPAVTGLYMQDCLGWTVQNSSFGSNMGTTWGANGAYLYGTQNTTSGSHAFTNCTFSGNTGISIARGLALVQTTSCTITNCVMSGNTAQTGYALGCFINNSAPGTNTIMSSTAQSNVVTSGDTYSEGIGFLLSTTGVLMSNCASINNSSHLGTGIGFFVKQNCYTNTFTMCNAMNNGTHGYYNNDASTTVMQCAAIGQAAQDFAGNYTPAFITMECGCIGRDGSLTPTGGFNVSWATQK